MEVVFCGHYQAYILSQICLVLALSKTDILVLSFSSLLPETDLFYTFILSRTDFRKMYLPLFILLIVWKIN